MITKQKKSLHALLVSLEKRAGGTVENNPIMDKESTQVNYHWGYKAGLGEAAKMLREIIKADDANKVFSVKGPTKNRKEVKRFISRKP